MLERFVVYITMVFLFVILATVSEFFTLKDNKKNIKTFVDKLIPITPPTDFFGVDAQPQNMEDLDIVFLIDRSFSIGTEPFKSTKCLMKVGVNRAFGCPTRDYRLTL